MTDLELLKLAAKAAGFKPRDDWAYDEAWGMKVSTGAPPYEWWNPLTDDGDALRLAVALGLTIEIGEPGFGDVQAGKKDHWACQWLGTDDPLAAVRRAIVSAAAKIGRIA
jgi:hypothetical protein